MRRGQVSVGKKQDGNASLEADVAGGNALLAVMSRSRPSDNAQSEQYGDANLTKLSFRESVDRARCAAAYRNSFAISRLLAERETR